MSEPEQKSALQSALGMSFDSRSDASTNLATIELLRMINATTTKLELIRSVTGFLKQWLNCDAIGIRLKDGDGYPYYEAAGFGDKFLRTERDLCSYNAQGEVLRDDAGNPLLECMCGIVLRNRCDPSKPFFTRHGSYWTNSTTEFLAGTAEADRGVRPRNRCNSEGYESVGLFPLRIGAETFGLLQVDDRRSGFFSPGMIAFLEQFGDNLAIRLAHLQTEEALRESEERHRTIIQTAMDGFWLTDIHGRLLEVNAAYGRMSGYSEQELLAMSISDVESAETFIDTLAHLQKIITQGEGRFAAVHRRKNSSTFDVEVNVQYQNTNGGRFVVFLQDISQRKEAERSLVAQMSFFEQMFTQSSISTQILDKEGWCERINPKLSQLFGVQPEHIEGKVYNIFKDEGIRQGGVLPHLEQVFREGKTAEWDVYFDIGIAADSENIKVKEKKKAWFHNWAYPIFDDQNRLSRVIVQHTDITGRKLAEENLRQLEARLMQSEKMEAVGQLAGGIAHDFNNVLAGIIGYTELSLHYTEKDSIVERNLLKVLQAADRAKHLVRQILTFSRQGSPQKSITAISPIVNEVLDLLRSSIPSSVRIETELHDDTKPVFADPTQIHQAILNLASNAVHAMNRKGILAITLYNACLDRTAYGRSGEIAAGEYTVIEVKDDGCGMDAAILSKAFEPFFTTKAVGEGTGMGLSVVLGIVQSHGGDIQVESGVGKGTTVRIFLPAAIDSVCGSAENTPLITRSGMERILFVDDEQMLVELAENILTRLGYTITGMSDSSAALKFVEEKFDDIDIIVTDQTMPGMTGIELAKEVRMIRKDLPIILCTGFSSEINAERTAAIGINQVVMKPYGAHDLSRSIRDVLDTVKKKNV